MNRTTWIIFSVLCVALLGGLVWVSQSSKLDVSKLDIWKIQPASKQSGDIADQVFGNKDAKVQIIEYGDFQCPGCDAAAPVLKQISEKYKDSVAFIFRDFPLSSIHPNARAAAAAAESAGLQGKFWEMHDKLYDNQKSWETLTGQARTDVFTSYASSLGLDKAKFLKDLDSKQVANKIDFDVALGQKAGVSATPSIYVNGKLTDQSVRDGKLVAPNNTDPYVWTDAGNFEKLILIPALEKAGVKVNQ